MSKAIFAHMLDNTDGVTTQALEKFSFKQITSWNNYQLYQAGDACVLVSVAETEKEKLFFNKHPQPAVYGIAIPCNDTTIKHVSKNYHTTPIHFSRFSVTACFEPFSDIVLYLMNETATQPFEQLKYIQKTPKTRSTENYFGADEFILDHFAIATDIKKLSSIKQFFINNLQFKEIYDLDINHGASGMRSIVLADNNMGLKLPLVAPHGDNSQVQQFINKNNGEGVQHIGLKCQNILATCEHLEKNGVEFLPAPKDYYSNNPCTIMNEEQQQKLRKYNILFDMIDPQHYLLQAFCMGFHKGSNESPFFFEVIQRHNHHTFTERNIRSLFESMSNTSLNAYPNTEEA